MFAPTQVPEPIIARVYQAMSDIMKNPDSVKALAEDGLVAVASSPDEFTAFVHAEIAEWGKLVREMKLQVQHDEKPHGAVVPHFWMAIKNDEESDQ